MKASADDEYVEYVTAKLPELRRLAVLLCGDPHRADDLVQQTITKLYVGWKRIRAVEHLDQYVRTMLTRTFISETRRPWSRVRLVTSSPEPLAANSSVAPHDSNVAERQRLTAALAQVPARQRAVLVLRFLCDQSIPQVAVVLGCSEGTVKSNTHRGLTTMRRLLGVSALTATGRSR